MEEWKKQRIMEQAVCIVILHPEFDDSDGPEVLRFAMTQDKPIVIWQKPGYSMPVPSLLTGYDHYCVIEAEPKEFAEQLCEFMEWGPDVELEIRTQSYHSNA